MINQPISKPYGFNSRILLVDYYLTLPNGMVLIVKAGLIYDGASFPRFLYTWFRPFCPEFEPFAVVHDDFFQRRTIRLEDGTLVTLHVANSIGMKVLELNGVNKYKRWLIKTGLALGSWLPWYLKGI